MKPQQLQKVLNQALQTLTDNGVKLIPGRPPARETTTIFEQGQYRIRKIYTSDTEEANREFWYSVERYSETFNTWYGMQIICNTEAAARLWLKNHSDQGAPK